MMSLTSGGGISVAWKGTVRNVIRGNIAYGIGGGGIHLRNDSTNNVAFGNSCTRNYSYGLLINSLTDKNAVVGNLCHDNYHGRGTDPGQMTRFYQLRFVKNELDNLFGDNLENWINDRVINPSFNISGSIVPDETAWSKSPGWSVGRLDPYDPPALTEDSKNCVAKFVGKSPNSMIQSLKLVNGETYRICYEVIKVPANQLTALGLIGPFGSEILRTEPGMHEIYRTCENLSAFGLVACLAGENDVLVIDNISITQWFS